MAKPILYEHPMSPYAQKNKIALYEKGVDFEARMPEGIGSGQSHNDFLAVSPRAEVPAFVDGATHIFQSSIIQLYIDEKWSDPPLFPRDPAARANARMIEEVVDTHLEAVNWGMGEVRFFQRAEGKLAEELTAAADGQTRKFFRWLSEKLGSADWFTQETDGSSFFGLADMAVAPHLNLSAAHGFHPDPGSALADWLERTNQKESVKRCTEAALASIGQMSQVGELISSGQFRREYRDHRLEWMVKSGGLEVVSKGLSAGNIRFADDFF